MRLIENRKKSLEQNKLVGAVLLDLSMAFHHIPNDLLILKMHAYEFSIGSLTLFDSYIKRHNQCIKINYAYYFLDTAARSPTWINT